MIDTETIIACVAKNQRETLHISLDRFKSYDLVHLRIFVRGDVAALVPKPKGFAVQVDKLDALIEALGDARAECVRRGLIDRA